MLTLLLTILFCLIAYCLGSLSSAIIVCRMAGLPDPRSEGSKNPGATNVLRIGGRKLAAVTLLGDALKGFIPVFVVKLFYPDPFIVGPVMLAVFLGHLYPIFFQFQGGKGVATFIGILLALSGWVGGAFVAIWLIMVLLFNISSLAALVSAAVAPLIAGFLLNMTYSYFIICMTLLLFWRHRENLKRLYRGTEPKIGKK